ncbi:hypothetical protein HPG69_003516 [Diceros bicornis minor]|uniref:Uncharacterized protein n=1 Tax=Diceros bicornis minor TaxID=77932 RepID=A0A7J7EHX8_DICBM|nr:hypothetical protein HPG69_003516 [Diceros bicornis minor]
MSSSVIAHSHYLGKVHVRKLNRLMDEYDKISPPSSQPDKVAWEIFDYPHALFLAYSVLIFNFDAELCFNLFGLLCFLFRSSLQEQRKYSE